MKKDFSEKTTFYITISLFIGIFILPFISFFGVDVDELNPFNNGQKVEVIFETEEDTYKSVPHKETPHFTCNMCGDKITNGAISERGLDFPQSDVEEHIQKYRRGSNNFSCSPKCYAAYLRKSAGY